jgi:hypothetical protein
MGGGVVILGDVSCVVLVCWEGRTLFEYDEGPLTQGLAVCTGGFTRGRHEEMRIGIDDRSGCVSLAYIMHYYYHYNHYDVIRPILQLFEERKNGTVIIQNVRLTKDAEDVVQMQRKTKFADT